MPTPEFSFLPFLMNYFYWNVWMEGIRPKISTNLSCWGRLFSNGLINTNFMITIDNLVQIFCVTETLSIIKCEQKCLWVKYLIVNRFVQRSSQVTVNIGTGLKDENPLMKLFSVSLLLASFQVSYTPTLRFG